MESTHAPDPFAALGLPSNATSADIKSAYRKLALKCHPDKVADEALKKIKQEEFHKIQQAYELIGDDERLDAYRAELRLEAQRKAKLASRAASGPNVTRYETRTAAPAGSGVPHRYEERKPTASRSFEDDYYNNSRSKYYDTYEAQPSKQSSSTRTSRPDKEPIRVTRVSADRSRSDRNKNRDKEERRSRTEKFSHLDEDPSSSNDEKFRFEKTYQKNSDDHRVRESAANDRRKADEVRIKVEEAARKKSESRRSYEEREAVKEPRRQRSDEREREPEHNRNTYDKLTDAKNYINGVRNGSSPNKSAREVPHETAYEGSRSRRDRPEQVRRSSARPRERAHYPQEIVDWERERPSMPKSTSSPAEIKIPPRATPIRSQTEIPHHSRRVDKSPTPQFRRSETAPTAVHTTSSSRREEYKSRPSTLRSSESLPHPTSSPEGAYPSVPHAQPSSSTKYYYPSPSGARKADHPEVANGHSTILREPHSRRTRSPSPMDTRPPMGPNRRTEAPVPPRTSFNAPPLMRSQTSYADERGRPQRLYGERTPAETLRRAEVRRQNSYSPSKDNISYSRRYHPEDVSYAHDREFSKPTFHRSATMAAH